MSSSEPLRIALIAHDRKKDAMVALASLSVDAASFHLRFEFAHPFGQLADGFHQPCDISEVFKHWLDGVVIYGLGVAATRHRGRRSRGSSRGIVRGVDLPNGRVYRTVAGETIARICP